MSDGESSQTGGVPDFFSELIARVIPGVVVVAISIYWYNGDFKKVYSDGLWVVALVVAWIIGVTLDLGVFGIYMLCLEKLRKIVHDIITSAWMLRHAEAIFCKLVTKILQEIVHDFGTSAWMLRDVEPLFRKLVTKMFAVLVFFRSMAVFCGFTVAICVVMPICPWCDFFLPRLGCCPCLYLVVSLVLGLVFGFCWYEEHRQINSWFESERVFRLNRGQSPADWNI
jgi:hypothetical protein